MIRRALVLTRGNLQLGDNGIAPQVARALLAGFCDAETKVRCCEQWLPEFAEPISETGLVVFVDSSSNLEPGEIRSQEVTPSDVAPREHAPAIDPAGLLALARQLYGQVPRSAFVVTIGGESFEPCEELSAVARQALPAALEQIKAILSGVSVPSQAGCWE
jgi:hydrogenase maturation protease